MINLEKAWQHWWIDVWGMGIARNELKLAFEAGYEARRAEEDEAMKVIRSAAKHYKTNMAIFCAHANEVPSRCPCESDCYCKSHTCKGK